MVRRALLVGAETFELVGVGEDVAVVEATLRGRGFTDIRTCQGDAATRDGIIAAYEKLIADTQDGDAVMVYYSGHGGYVHPLPGEAVEVARTNRQFIVPTDYGESKPGDFRGITAVELSVLLGRLTERTDNAVVVLDCCHSAMMSRDPGALLAKQVPDATMVDLQAHVRKQVEAGLAVDLAEPEGNKKAVRVAACGQDQFAYQQRQAGVTGAYGLLTEALVTALREAAGVRVSWARLIVRVRQLVQLNFAHQWPSAEGPSERVLFETRADDAVGSLPVVVVDDATARIDGAAVLGVQVGDEFAVVPGTVAEFDPADAVAEVRIERRTPTDASGPLTYLTRGGEVPAGARAYRTKATTPQVPVRVPAELADVVRASMFARVADPGEDAAMEVVVDEDGLLCLHDSIGPLHRPRRPGPEALRGLLDNIDRVARATVLLQIRDQDGWTFDAPVTLEWGRIANGVRHPAQVDGPTVHIGDAMYLEVRNTGDVDLYVSLVDVGLAYAVTPLTPFAPSGVRLPPQGRYPLGGTSVVQESPYATRDLGAATLEWPTGLDATAPRPETVLVLISTMPHDISALRQSSVKSVDRKQSPLTALLHHLCSGQTRDLRPPPRAAGQYCALAAEFMVVPQWR